MNDADLIGKVLANPLLKNTTSLERRNAVQSREPQLYNFYTFLAMKNQFPIQP
jgi:hypothetical protein